MKMCSVAFLDLSLNTQHRFGISISKNLSRLNQLSRAIGPFLFPTLWVLCQCFAHHSNPVLPTAFYAAYGCQMAHVVPRNPHGIYIVFGFRKLLDFHPLAQLDPGAFKKIDVWGKAAVSPTTVHGIVSPLFRNHVPLPTLYR